MYLMGDMTESDYRSVSINHFTTDYLDVLKDFSSTSLKIRNEAISEFKQIIDDSYDLNRRRLWEAKSD